MLSETGCNGGSMAKVNLRKTYYSQNNLGELNLNIASKRKIVTDMVATLKMQLILLIASYWTKI